MCALVVLCAVGAACTVASAQTKRLGPAGPKHNRGPKVLSSIAPAPVQPQLIEWVGVRRLPDGRLIPTTPVTPYQPPVGDDPSQNAFDIFQSDAAGAPFGGIACGQPTEGNRWYFGEGFTCSNYVNDFQVAPAAVGAPIDRLDIGWNWGVGALRPMWVLVETYDTFVPCGGTPPPAATFVDGIALHFADAAGGGGYYYTNVGLPPDPVAALGAPADGIGAYHLSMGIYDQVAQTFTFDNVLGTQAMLWGINSPGQLGVHLPNEWDDDGGTGANTSDGTFIAAECYNYPAGIVACPNAALGAMMAFWTTPGSGGPVCYPNCDGSTTAPCLNVQDFGCFLNEFAAGNSYANCDNSTTPPVLNVQDFGCFLNEFAAGCSGC